MFQRMFATVVSSPGTRDSIFVGFVTQEGAWLKIERAVSIQYYERGGIGSIPTHPEYSTRVPLEGPGVAYVLISNVSSMLPADLSAWQQYLPPAQ